ncbi:PKD domain-containing protein [Shewanella sp. D64]|uniref:PKD domain-containing protein n=1 Tax=unclassified Shewanella TaxID=196818 RepID=UPI0022BA1CC9|nr:MULTISPECIES: PKD domain-containing protein [unclassified Shewanella]MEC4727696.1 PKD domain-containing protein [Shewanella sp. D64]MEC4739731.1 PKD domain-containing protein [Shewanella sp. E94]WBJ94091.1 PKD domain-containing protein [Shewanella sp. MTB7]
MITLSNPRKVKYPKLKAISAVILSSLFIAPAWSVSSEVEIITKAPWTQSALKQAVAKEREVKSVTRYNMQLEGFKQETSSLKFELPDASVIIAKKTLAYITGSGSLVWQGEIVNQNAALFPGDNQIILVKSDEFLSATIKFNGRLFKMKPSNNQQIELKEIDQTLLPDEHSEELTEGKNSIFNERGGYSVKPLSVSPSATTSSVIRVLVGFTSEALNQNPGMQALIDLAVAETNQGFTDSGVNAQVELAHSYELNYAESGDHGLDLDRFHLPNDGYMDDVYQIREQYSADVAAILIGDASACGRAREIGASEETAFMVIKDSCATGYYSFGHELGHLMSARHNPEKDSNTTPYAFGHGFLYSQGGWRSIMSYNSNSCCTRQNFWSDPTRSFQSVVRGTTGTHDNARVLNLTAATVAGFRSGGDGNLPPVAAFIYSANDLSVDFTDVSSDPDNQILTTLWDFGDGATSNASSPTHVYQANGQYQVSLRVTDEAGSSNTNGQTISVTAGAVNQAPDANFIYNAQGLTINFIDQSQDLDGQIVSWLWDFGDNSQSSEQAPKHVYQTAGNYWVELLVTDNEGEYSSHRVLIEITAQTLISSENFESGLGDWSNNSSSDWDWSRLSGATASSSTGPDSGVGGQGYYLYLETSNNKGAYTAGEQAVIESRDWNVSQPRFSFDYHMYGANIGTLVVDMFKDGSWNNNIWQISGQQQSSSTEDYRQANVDLSAYSGAVRFRLRAVAAGGWKGDIAIDNLQVYGTPFIPENQAPVFTLNPSVIADASVDLAYRADISAAATDPDGDVLTFSIISAPAWISLTANGLISGTPESADLGLNTMQVRVTDPQGASSEAQVELYVVEATIIALTSLDFEAGFNNGWSHGTGASHEWETEAGTTPSSSTGPAAGANTQSTYAYLETSKDFAYSAGNTAYLDSPTLAGTARLLSFHYHMYGAEIGSLSVDIFHQGNWQTALFQVSGEQQLSSSEAYQYQEVDLSSFEGDITVRFRAEAAGGWKGDIAIDDIKVEGYP